MASSGLLSPAIVRWLAPTSFIFNLVAQIYGMTSTPNMKDVNDENQSFFSPQPFFIAGFFSIQQVLQLAFLYFLVRLNPKSGARQKSDVELLTSYAPYYAIGNFCIGIWMFFWNASQLKLADIFVWINTGTQLFYMLRFLPTMNLSSVPSVLTHLVCKTFAGIGVLDVLHNTSVAFFKDEQPGLAVMILTGLGFIGAILASDWIFGACLIYDLLALAVGQNGQWRMLLSGYAILSVVLLIGQNVRRPPYKRESVYENADAEDYEEI